MALWDKITSRGSVDDRRADGPSLARMGSAGLTVAVAILALNLLSGNGIDPTTLEQLLGTLQQSNITQQQNIDASEFVGEDSYEVFASTIVGSTNDLWRQVFAQNGQEYREPKLVLFRGATESGCGVASSQSGPHYCPVDETIYLDETFFDDIYARLGGTNADVAQAYVIAHEAGHHAQKLLDIMDQVPNGSNEASVRLELQADCFAGLWAYSIRDLGVFENGEINEAIAAAEVVGDDHIQEATTGTVHPETWTHGSSAQRVSWFNRGYTTGDVSQCNTF